MLSLVILALDNEPHSTSIALNIDGKSRMRLRPPNRDIRTFRISNYLFCAAPPRIAFHTISYC